MSGTEHQARQEDLRRREDFRAGLSGRELVAYTIGVHLGRGGQMPDARTLDILRRKCGDDRSSTCRKCGVVLPPPPAPGKGRPPVNCPACRGAAQTADTTVPSSAST